MYTPDVAQESAAAAAALKRCQSPHVPRIDGSARFLQGRIDRREPDNYVSFVSSRTRRTRGSGVHKLDLFEHAPSRAVCHCNAERRARTQRHPFTVIIYVRPTAGETAVRA